MFAVDIVGQQRIDRLTQDILPVVPRGNLLLGVDGVVDAQVEAVGPRGNGLKVLVVEAPASGYIGEWIIAVQQGQSGAAETL